MRPRDAQRREEGCALEDDGHDPRGVGLAGRELETDRDQDEDEQPAVSVTVRVQVTAPNRRVLGKGCGRHGPFYTGHGGRRGSTASEAGAGSLATAMANDEFRVEINLHDAVHGHLTKRLLSLDLDDEVAEDEMTADVRRRRWNPAERFWQDADEPLAEPDVATPDPARHATNRDVPHPAFVFIERHEPEFLRDLL